MSPTKLVHALWADHRTDHWADHWAALLAGDLHERLAAAGVRRLQVNLDDADISENALRLHTGEPIRAVLSSWIDEETGSTVDAVTATLRELDASVAGWRVEERIPTAAPVVPDGQRADALANLAFIRRPAELSRAAWLAHWHGPHTVTAIQTQATFGYVQNVVLEPLTPAGTRVSPPVDGIVEELFPMAGMHDIHAFYGSAGDDAELNRRLTRLMDSVATLGADHDIDLVPTSRYCFDLG